MNIRNKIIAVYGLGNVGGPIAAAWLKKGATVIGVDVSNSLLESIKNGTSHSKEPYISGIFSKYLKKKKFFITNDGKKASHQSNIKIIAVPVAIKKNSVDLKAILSASESISSGLKKGDAVIISPSLPPGTTEKIIRTILENKSNLIAEKDFYLIYNPERIFEGRALQDIEENYPAIVAGIGKKSLQFGNNLLKIISKKGVLKMSGIANAEAEKLFEGVYRDVNIALANELSNFCEKSGVNFWEARTASNSQPFCHLHYPGTGVGGLCIPIYPQFVLQTSKKLNIPLKLIENSRKMNDSMPKKCVKDAIQLLKNNHKKQGKIAILGLGFRGEVTDSRLSPTYDVVKEFLKKGFDVHVHDPYIENDSLLPTSVELSKNLTSVVKDAELIFISTDHKKYKKLNKKSLSSGKKPLLIFDGRNILNRNNFDSKSILTIGLRTN